MSVDDQLQPEEAVLYRAYTTRISLVPRAALAVLAAVGALIAWRATDAHPGYLPLAIALGVITLVLSFGHLAPLGRARSVPMQATGTIVTPGTRRAT